MTHISYGIMGGDGTHWLFWERDLPDNHLKILSMQSETLDRNSKRGLRWLGSLHPFLDCVAQWSVPDLNGKFTLKAASIAHENGLSNHQELHSLHRFELLSCVGIDRKLTNHPQLVSPSSGSAVIPPSYSVGTLPWFLIHNFQPVYNNDL